MINEINKCIEVLKSGGLILYPTDTVWGIGCDATNEEAVKKIYELKQRNDSKSMIVIIANDAMLNKHVVEVPDLAWDIIDISDKPTTIIYPKAKNLAKNVIAEDGSIGIRMVKKGVDYVVNPTFDNGNHQPSSIIKIGLRGEIEVIRK